MYEYSLTNLIQRSAYPSIFIGDCFTCLSYPFEFTDDYFTGLTQSLLALLTWELISYIEDTPKLICFANYENTLIVSGPLSLPARDILCDGTPDSRI